MASPVGPHTRGTGAGGRRGAPTVAPGGSGGPCTKAYTGSHRGHGLGHRSACMPTHTTLSAGWPGGITGSRVASQKGSPDSGAGVEGGKEKVRAEWEEVREGRQYISLHPARPPPVHSLTTCISLRAPCMTRQRCGISLSLASIRSRTPRASPGHTAGTHRSRTPGAAPAPQPHRRGPAAWPDTTRDVT